MKKILSGIIGCALLAGFALAQSSVDPMNLPKLTQRVTDFSATLTTSQLSELNAVAKNYENETSSQLVTVLFPHRQGQELIDIGMKIFTDNAIGQKDKNNGLLLLISTEEKKIRIIVGYGLEGVYPDLMASQVIENDIRPLVNSSDFAGAVRAFYDKSIQILSGEIPAGYTTSSPKTRDDSSTYIGIIIGFFLGLLLKSFLKGKYKKLGKTAKRIIGVGLLVLFAFAFLAGIYIVGSFLLFLFFGLIFGMVGFLPGRFGGGMFGGGFGGGGGGFSGGGGGSGGGGAGD